MSDTSEVSKIAPRCQTPERCQTSKFKINDLVDEPHKKMNCKNCKAPLTAEDQYCKKCGAKVIKEPITLKSLIEDLVVIVGWESNFLLTLRYLCYQPQKVFQEYIFGTRKKYSNPFSLFTIVIAVSLFVFSTYSEELIQLTFDGFQPTGISEGVTSDSERDKAYEVLGYESERDFQEAFMRFQLKYYNIFAFLFLPVYSLISFLVFRKPYNYGEHLVINTYILSIVGLVSLMIFLFSLFTGINIYGSGVLLLQFLYYCFAFQRLYRLSFGKFIVKILKFFGLLIVLGILFAIGGSIYAYIKVSS